MKLLTSAGSIAKERHGCSGGISSLCEKTKIRSARRNNLRDVVKSRDKQNNDQWEPIFGHQTKLHRVDGSMVVFNWMRG